MTLETAGAISSLKAAIEDGSMPSWPEQRSHVQQLIKEICQSYDPIKDGMVVNAVTGHQEEAQEQISRIVSLLDAPQFHSSPPFTMQRMAELLTEPFKYYPQNQQAKFLRALERVLLVSSSIDDYGAVSVDIHDVPTVEDGEKIKPDTGIVLTPIPWISEEDTAKLERAGEVEEENAEAETVDESENGTHESVETESVQAESTESEESESKPRDTTETSAANISVEMADVSGDNIPETMATHDVSVEMTDADMSAEMATHDVSDEAAKEIRQAKNEEAQGDLLTTIVADVSQKHEKEEEEEQEESGKETESADATGTVTASAAEKEPESSSVQNGNTPKEDTQEVSEGTSEGAPQAEAEGAEAGDEHTSSTEDRDAKRLKTE
ncbi:Serine/threonine-protein phosphatase 4 regulatory subunit 2 [Yarrowia sp. C11]|nr:Serine/threonine-protein phosphatase 4 regulatory subunit 2 [Yarrowia sp. E02]KAG5369299.1 Serine/threonine-protein phosphatase 4 regulatory subunit 2 [Yarrowia sp. C11]